MIKKLSLIGIAVILSLAAQHFAIASEPAITGNIEGVELCPEFVCEAAVFVGKFKGQVDNKRAKGGFFVAVNHDPLPGPLQFANITGGEWFLRANRHFFSGDVLNGTIFNNGDNTFTVEAQLQLTSGGSGEIIATVQLDHNVIPFEVDGDISQNAGNGSSFSHQSQSDKRQSDKGATEQFDFRDR
jgi:hypothetical protein